jgi:hypothetical protein
MPLSGDFDDDGDGDNAFFAALATQVATQANRAAAAAAALPRVVITSFHMAERVSRDIASIRWGAVIVVGFRVSGFWVLGFTLNSKPWGPLNHATPWPRHGHAINHIVAPLFLS